MTASIEKFTVRFVNKGDTYGRNFCLTHDKDEPMIEFYDARYPHTEFGQFVSRYYVKTLRGHTGGLILDGGIPEWTVSSAGMEQVQNLIEQSY